MKKNVLIISSFFAITGGLYFIGTCIFYILSYINDASNPMRYEYIQGAFIALMLSAPFWIIASTSLFVIKSSVPKKIFKTVIFITGIILFILILMNIYPLFIIIANYINKFI